MSWPSVALMVTFITSLAIRSAQSRPFAVPGVPKQLASAQACVQAWAAASAGQEANTTAAHSNSSAGAPSSWTSQRLAAVYLHAFTSAGQRDSMLACSIQRLLSHLGPMTPTDVFVFTREEGDERVRRLLTQELGPANASRVCLLTIPRQQWYFQPRKVDFHLPAWGTWHTDYLIMGLWRMLVPYTLVSDLGYPFFLQIDDDLMIMDPVKVNLVQAMLRHNRTIATHRMPLEYWHVMNGLPELAKFFLTSNKLQPGGSLLEHVQPRNLGGLFSMQHNWWKNAKLSRDGYDLTVLFGNFMIMSAALWRDPRVQDWLTLCIHSGGLERHRWQEQGVFAFVWLLFTEPHQLWRLSREELHWLHTRRPSKLKGVCPLASSSIRQRRATQQRRTLLDWGSWA